MDLDDLRLIRLLVEDANLTHSAQKVQLTQSALSKKLKGLEAEVGFQLFERHGPRGLKPTQRAMELATLSEKTFDLWKTGLKRVRSISGEPRNFVLVGPQLFLREILLPWWTEVASEFPDLQLDVRVGRLSHIPQESLYSGADASILEDPSVLPAEFARVPFHEERWGIVRHPGSKFKDLSQYKWGGYSHWDNPVETWLVKRGKMSAPRYAVFWQDLTALAIWVADTPGAATVLPWHVVTWLEKRQRVTFEPISGSSTTTLYLAYPKGSPHARFIDALKKIGPKMGQK